MPFPPLPLKKLEGDDVQDFARFRVTFCFQFGIDQLPVHTDLELASVRGNQGHRLDHMLIIFEQFFCQAHGPASVMSNCAVNDLDINHNDSNKLVLENYNTQHLKACHALSGTL